MDFLKKSESESDMKKILVGLLMLAALNIYTEVADADPMGRRSYSSFFIVSYMYQDNCSSGYCDLHPCKAVIRDSAGSERYVTMSKFSNNVVCSTMSNGDLFRFKYSYAREGSGLCWEIDKSGKILRRVTELSCFPRR
ncbi:hypothetical protein N9W79_00320 [bacterium]|nr:hypothetical protein [bacterium]